MKVQEISCRKGRIKVAGLIQQISGKKSYSRIIPYTKDRYKHFVVKDNTKIIGATIVDTVPTQAVPDELVFAQKAQIYIVGTYVVPKYRQRKIASLIRHYLLEKYDSIITGTSCESHSGIYALNRSTGFQIVHNYDNGNCLWFWSRKNI